MPRFLALLAFLSLALPLAAQSTYGNPNGEAHGYWLESNAVPHYLEAPPHGNPNGQWTSNLTPNPKFPVTVRLIPTDFNYDGVSYTGNAQAHIFNGVHVGEDLDFHYSCGAGFLSGEYYARWNKAANRIEIRIRNPGTNETRSCKMKIVATAIPPSHPTR